VLAAPQFNATPISPPPSVVDRRSDEPLEHSVGFPFARPVLSAYGR
jgi:hypothetical protein